MKAHIFAAIAIGAVALATTGCASQKTLYEWHDYDAKLYKYYEKPETAEEFRVGLETAVKEVEKDKRKVAPGICAEIGTLYLQKGDRSSAVTWYKKERDTWAESATFMNALIKNLETKN